jgi:hypothetical protein
VQAYSRRKVSSFRLAKPRRDKVLLRLLSDDIYEQAVLEGGAVDFVDKARRLPILLRRLQLIAQGGRSAPEREPVGAPSLSLGQLMLRFDTNRALWAGRAVDLGPSVTVSAHTAYPELRVDRPCHQPGDAAAPDPKPSFAEANPNG